LAGDDFVWEDAVGEVYFYFDWGLVGHVFVHVFIAFFFENLKKIENLL